MKFIVSFSHFQENHIGVRWFLVGLGLGCENVLNVFEDVDDFCG